MHFIQPSVEWWPQDKTISQHIARVGRICYKAHGKQPSPDLTEEQREAFIEKRDHERCEAFWQSGHRSMLRHGTKYYFVEDKSDLPMYAYSIMGYSSYIHHRSNKTSTWISANLQYLMEKQNIAELLAPYEVTENKFIEEAIQRNCQKVLLLLRMTFVVTSQISTSRELNRTSPNNIAEQSTRYVNMEKKGGVQIAKPHWFSNGSFLQRILFKAGCKVSEWIYLLLLRCGLKPEDARGILPLDAYTVVAYTYNLFEWHHIMDLRLRGKTGKPHPNARIIAEQISNIINNRMRAYNHKYSI